MKKLISIMSNLRTHYHFKFDKNKLTNIQDDILLHHISMEDCYISSALAM